MKNMNNISNMVKKVLIEIPETRDDDNLLWLEALRESLKDRKSGYAMADLTLAYVLKSIHKLGLPSFETVSRARRKLQAKYPELRGSENVRRERAKKEKTFKEYSKNGVCI